MRRVQREGGRACAQRVHLGVGACAHLCVCPGRCGRAGRVAWGRTGAPVPMHTGPQAEPFQATNWKNSPQDLPRAPLTHGGPQSEGGKCLCVWQRQRPTPRSGPGPRSLHPTAARVAPGPLAGGQADTRHHGSTFLGDVRKAPEREAMGLGVSPPAPAPFFWQPALLRVTSPSDGDRGCGDPSGRPSLCRWTGHSGGTGSGHLVRR